MFDCINRALQLKDAITRVEENNMELDDRIGGENDENTSDGEPGRVVEEMVRTTHPHSLYFLYIYIYVFLSCPLPLLAWGCKVNAVLCVLKTMRPTEPQLEKLTDFQIRGLAGLLRFLGALKGHVKAELPVVFLTTLDEPL